MFTGKVTSGVPVTGNRGSPDRLEAVILHQSLAFPMLSSPLSAYSLLHSMSLSSVSLPSLVSMPLNLHHRSKNLNNLYNVTKNRLPFCDKKMPHIEHKPLSFETFSKMLPSIELSIILLFPR